MVEFRHSCRLNYEGATTSRSREPGPLWFRLQAPRAPPVFVFAESAPNERGGKLVRPGTFGQPAFPARHAAPVGACGISQVSWRPILRLCPAPRPRPSRQNLALAVLPTPPPAYPNRRPQRVHNLEANTGLQHPLSTLHERRRRLPCKTRFRLAGCASTGRGSNPLDRCERFQVTFPFSFPGLLLSQGSSTPSGRSADCEQTPRWAGSFPSRERG